MSSQRIGIIGFGALGQYLYQQLVLNKNNSNNTSQIKGEVVLIWNRTPEKIREVKFEVENNNNNNNNHHQVPNDLIITDMKQIAERKCDILLEVCHPDVLAENIELWLQSCTRAIYVGSPTGFANTDVLERTLATAHKLKRQIFVPTGALWGVQDIAKMGARKAISELHITMKKPAASTRLNQPLQKIVEDFEQEGKDAAAAAASDAGGADDDEPEEQKKSNKKTPLRKDCVVFDGPIGDLCPLAPNNVNTMACAALASGPEIGFRNARGTFVIERDSNVHVIEIEVVGKPQPGFTEPLRVKTQRVNPCAVGAVTGMATYVSFYSSLIGVMKTMASEREDAVVETGLRFC